MTTVESPAVSEPHHEPASASPVTDVGPAPPAPRRPGLNVETIAMGGIFIALFSFIAALFAIGLAARAIDEHEAVAATVGAAPAGAGASEVSLTEFSISPDPLEVAAGSSLSVTNDGAVIHNLSVEGIATPMLESGDSSTLDLSGLAPGSYTVICDVAGHAAAGMEATLNVG